MRVFLDADILFLAARSDGAMRALLKLLAALLPRLRVGAALSPAAAAAHRAATA